MDDAGLIDLVETYEQSFEEAQSPLVREMEAALELLRRRAPQPPSTRQERDRALGILIRRGYAPELAFDALRRYAGVEAEPEF